MKMSGKLLFVDLLTKGFGEGNDKLKFVGHE
jgi:hypothetical protein